MDYLLVFQVNSVSLGHLYQLLLQVEVGGIDLVHLSPETVENH